MLHDELRDQDGFPHHAGNRRPQQYRTAPFWVVLEDPEHYRHYHDEQYERHNGENHLFNGHKIVI